jgi:nitroreductase
MDLRDALRGTGSARTFAPEPIDDTTLLAILDDARFAPSGGNRQPWRVAIVRDAHTRRVLGEHMRRVWNQYVAERDGGRAPFSHGSAAPAVSPAAPPVAAPHPILDHIETVPAMLVVAADLRRIALMDGNLDRPTMTGGASIYPFCWSILLAARERGLGGVITTFIARAEPEVAPLLGLPADHALVATLFIGRPEHQNTKLSRRGVSEFTSLERFDGAPFGG